MFASSKPAALVLAFGLSTSAFAEESHHPPTGAASAPQTAQTPQPQPDRPMQPGMGPTGPGMMGQGGGMMGGMMNQGGMPGMMQMMRAGQHVEGRLAFIKAELKITGAQEKVWNDFTDAVRRASAKVHEAGGMRAMSGMASAATPIQVAEQYEKNLAARLEAVRIVRPALEPLYTSLSDEQKKTFTQVHMILHGII
jgi:hypothetical protein